MGFVLYSKEPEAKNPVALQHDFVRGDELRVTSYSCFCYVSVAAKWLEEYQKITQSCTGPSSVVPFCPRAADAVPRWRRVLHQP